MITTKYTLPTPPSYNNLHLKIAILGDIHDRPISKALEAVRREKPDLILLPGDLLTGHICKEAWEKDDRICADKLGVMHEKCQLKEDYPWQEPKNAVRILQELVTVAPTYMSRGNHEAVWTDADIDFVKSLGVHVLHNRYERVSDKLVLGGLTSPDIHRLWMNADEALTAEKPKPQTAWLNDFEKQTGCKILLMHEPHLWQEYIKGRNIDLTVSAHAHGGQIRLFGRGLFAPGQGFFPKLTKGFCFDNRLLVSTGLANTARFIPRIGNPTELVILEIGTK